MDLAYGPKYENIREEVRTFAAEYGHLAPPPTAEEKERVPWQQLLLQKGYAGRNIPKIYGGYGAALDILENRVIEEEFIRSGIPLGLANQGISMLVPTLLDLGTEQQRLELIPGTLSGDIIWCQGYSEPGAGSDLAALQTSAVEDGDDFIINGQKIWTSSAHYADMIFCLVRTEPGVAKHAGISYLLFSMRTPGIEVRPLITATGRGEFNEVFFTDVRVPRHQIVGQRGQGWQVANATLKYERGMLGDPTASEARFNRIAEIMQTERIDGRRPIDEPVWRERLLRLQGRLMAMRNHGMRLLTSSLRQEPVGLPEMVVKLQGCELNYDLDAFAIDLLGELGILFDGSPHLRFGARWQHEYMFDLGLIIGGGTAQIQKNIISERGLGMPREPKPAMA